MTDIKTKVLLVEDDENFGDVLKSYLEMSDYDVTHMPDGEAGKDAFVKGEFDLCILDVMMPKKDGFTLGREIREIDQEIPLIFLTAKSLKEDVLEGLKLGADDYMTKPFNPEELLLRIQAILRRKTSASNPSEDIKEFEIGDFVFNYPLRTLTYNSGEGHDESKLSPKESELLRLFCINKNEVLSRSEALTKIWGEDHFFNARSMDVFVTKLRKYLKKDENLKIVNIHGVGFRLLVPEKEEHVNS